MRQGSTPHRRIREVAAKVEATQRVLEAEVARLVSGEDWRRFLDFQSRFHCYSAGNAQLIAAAHAQAFAEGRVAAPQPSFVAGYWTWRAVGRQVEKGQRGYPVLAPVRQMVREAVDPAGGRRTLTRAEQPRPAETVVSRQVLKGWTVEHVWDVSQTSGAAVPEPPGPRLLEGEAPEGLRQAVVGLVESKGFAVGAVPDAGALGGANGRTDWVARTVVVRSDMDDAAQVKTLIHEAAHVLLHAEAPGWYLSRPTKEVEAESVAYVVCAAHGMPTGGYSFPYIAAWAGDDGPRAVAAAQARVAEAARALIAVSPAEHTTGGKSPGVDVAVEAAAARRLRVVEPPTASVQAVGL